MRCVLHVAVVCQFYSMKTVWYGRPIGFFWPRSLLFSRLVVSRRFIFVAPAHWSDTTAAARPIEQRILFCTARGVCVCVCVVFISLNSAYTLSALKIHYSKKEKKKRKKDVNEMCTGREKATERGRNSNRIQFEATHTIGV